MGQTAGMGFQVHAVVQMSSKPSDALMTTLADHFEEAHHSPGSKVVSIMEHVSVASEADAVAFVRSLVLDAVPQGSKITEIRAEAD